VRRIASLGLALLALGWVGCGSADQPPLGGPFGGVATVNPAPGADASVASSLSAAADSGSGNTSGGAVDSGSGSGSGDDAGGTPACSTSSTVPTFSQIYTNYLATGTVGNCAQTSCHSQMSSAGASYTWLQGQTKDCGSPNCLETLTSSTGSCLQWFGGSMPPGGNPSDQQATCDISAWFAAGAKNN